MEDIQESGWGGTSCSDDVATHQLMPSAAGADFTRKYLFPTLLLSAICNLYSLKKKAKRISILKFMAYLLHHQHLEY